VKGYDGAPRIIRIRRKNLLESITAIAGFQGNLIVTGFYIFLIREDPYLKKFLKPVFILVVFAVCNARTRAHYLHIPGFDNRYVAHVVFVFQFAFERNGNDFHIVVGMCSESHTCFHTVIIQYPQRAKIHPFRVVVIREAECVPAVEPAVIRVPAGFRFVKNYLCHYYLEITVFFLLKD